MDIKQLEYFLKVYEDGSFSKAASHLFITQQGLNKSIQNLEKELNTSLFVRTPHGLIPTDAGDRLKKQAEPYLSQWSDILRTIRQSGNASDHTLRIGFDIGMMGLTPPDFFPNYLNRHPDEDIRLINTISDSRHMLMNNELDIAFCQPPVDSDFFQNLVVSYHPVTLAVSVENPLSQKETVCISDLKGQRLMDFSLDSPAQLYYRDYCKEKGIEPAIMLNASQGPEITNFVSRNAAVSFFAGESDWLPDTIRSIPFSDMQVLSGYHMIVKKGRYLNPLACNFIEEYQAATGGSAN